MINKDTIAVIPEKVPDRLSFPTKAELLEKRIADLLAERDVLKKALEAIEQISRTPPETMPKWTSKVVFIIVRKINDQARAALGAAEEAT